MSDDQASAWPQGAGEMAARIRTHDWATTPLGSIQSWPQSLHTAIDMMLAMPGPANILWGLEHIQIYNDAYIAVAKERHPAALGRSASENWQEIHAEVLAPIMEAIFAGRATHLADLAVQPKGTTDQLEVRAFDTTWSPIPDGFGNVGGALEILVEVTDRRRANAALSESEARHRLLIGGWAQAVWETDPNGVIIADSPSWRAYTGQSLEEWLGYGWLNAIHPDDRACAEQQWREGIAARSLVNAEFRLRAFNGGWRWTNIRAAPVLDAAGNIEKWAGINIDIDAQKGAEAVLRESEARLVAAFESVPVGAAVIDLSGTALISNNEYRRFLPNGVVPSRDPDRGARWQGWDLYGQPLEPNDFPAARALRGEDVLPGQDMLYVDDDGREIWTSVATAATRDDRGQVTGLVTTISDIDMAKRSAEALRLREEQLRGFGEASIDVLWIRDVETLAWTYLTPAFEPIYGLSRDEALGGDDFRTWIDLIVPEDRERARSFIDRVRQGENVTFEYRIHRPSDGAIRWLRNTDFPIRDTEGRITAIGGVGHDATQEKEADRIIRASRRQLRTLVEGMAQLVWRAVACGDWTWASPQWTTYTGQSNEDSTGQGWLAMVHPDDHERALDAWHWTEETEEPLNVEYRIRQVSDGSYRWFQTRALPVRDEETGHIMEWLGTSTDINDLRELQDSQAVMVAELQHRTRNLIAVVSSIARQIMAETGPTEAFRPAFMDRMEALSRVQGLLSHAGQERVTVQHILEMELAALGAPRLDGSIRFSGPEVPLRKSIVQTLTLAIHELATNARKYGALADGTGKLLVQWNTTRAENEERRLFLEWIESGIEIQMSEGEAVTQGGGYGRKLIEKSLPYTLKAKTTYVLSAAGLRCTIDLPLTKRVSKELHP